MKKTKVRSGRKGQKGGTEKLIIFSEFMFNENLNFQRNVKGIKRGRPTWHIAQTKNLSMRKRNI